VAYKQLIVFLLLLFLMACGQDPSSTVPLETMGGITAVVPSPTTLPPDTPTPIPPLPTFTPTAVIPATTQAQITDLAMPADGLYLYPVPYIIDGDRVTFQVIPHVPASVNYEDVTVHIFLNGEELTSGGLVWRNLSARPEAVFEWAWDSTGLTGEHEIQIVLDKDDRIQIGDEDPTNNQLTTTVVVQDINARTAQEVNATWVTAENECCLVHVISGTAAYRDLPDLLVMLDEAVGIAAARLDEPARQKIEIYFIDRVIGQGGYAGSVMVISYLDRPYNGEGLFETLVHESVHIIDRQFAPQRISFLAEGVAVWATGGHYKPEDLSARSAALVSMGEYVPLAALADNFYPVQHEIGYLEAGGFVKYLVETYGWSLFRDFYSQVTLKDALLPSEALDQNLQLYYAKTLAQMEAEWLAYLAGLVVDETAVTDLATTIRFFDVMRRYQIHYDPTAYFLTAWLPYPQNVKERGNTVDLTRHPGEEINITLEAMLQAADAALRSGNFSRANVILDSISRVLDSEGLFIDPLAVNYLNIVRAAAAEGYEVQRVNLVGERAELVVTRNDTAFLNQFNIVLRGGNWILSN
jgi:hypothetical protein